MASIDDLLGQMRLPERTFNLCTRADLQGEWEQAEQTLARAELQARDSLVGNSAEVRELASRVQDLEAEMAAHTVAIKLRARTHKEWMDLLAKHPPREGNDNDGAFNSATFGPALLAECAVDPVMSEEQAGKLVDSMSTGQWNDLFNTLWGLNRSGVDVPKSRRASEALQSSPKK
ncbi:hypothetical protein FXF51_06155 [Nonomuraea sp. PA05]|uniref:hypothetical protein n=1 Tax=Nonomuraea sp. PA05 TaxID=2604466 RepID=UPI0011D80F7A|nr:hypothetical protein [Nonomuraea sp. PA05]TYB69743.1 hypothetical protein FXF51_06155 [Nonomuraea sp. PA05]